MNIEKRKHRKQDVAARANTPDTSSRTFCSIPGCGKPTRAAAGQGLNTRFCRRHEDFYQRHGSPYRGSYAHKTVNSYRRAAFDWLTENAEDFWVKNAVAGVEGLYRSAGPMIEAFRLRGLKPEERARAAWARLRKAEIDRRLPLAAWIAIEMIVRDDAQAVTTVEYRRVQAAKIIHRMASGTHKRWELPRLNGKVMVTELHKFPMSRGRVLRYIGEDIEHVAELVVEHHLGDITAFKAQREKDSKLGKRAWPENIEGAAKRRRKAGEVAPQSPAAEPAQVPLLDPPQPVAVLEPDPTRKRPYSVTLPDGTIVTYN